MSYQSSAGTGGISSDLVVVASLAVAFSMFVAGYTATRASLSESSSQITADLNDTQINVVGHEGTLWESVSQPAQ
ncbi:MAG: hypothetical protein AAF329_11570 [Cyanobacteria bacterium P01_A01_bin.17]